MPEPPSPRQAVVAIPARDEADRLPACLTALARQRDVAPGSFGVVVLANNCTDDTAAAARAMAPRLPFRLTVEAVTLPPGQAHAGGARRAAMAAAARQNPAVLLSTDADARATPGWLAANLRAIRAGADAVAGAIAFDPDEVTTLPAALRQREAAEARYAALLDEIAARIDADPHDPWPRHPMHSGASMALTLAAYRRIGGVPEVAAGEDRALFQAVIGHGLRVRHCLAARVHVSCRLDGRASGGMAETLRQRLQASMPLDPALEAVAATVLRLRCRNALRQLQAGRPRPGDPTRLALALGIAPGTLAAIIARPGFTAAWEALQAATPVLRRRWPVALEDLPRETRRARLLLGTLRRLPPRFSPAWPAADPAGIPAAAPSG